MKTFNVQTSPDVWQTVRAAGMENEDGDIRFYVYGPASASGTRTILMLARGQWISVTEEPVVPKPPKEEPLWFRVMTALSLLAFVITYVITFDSAVSVLAAVLIGAFVLSCHLFPMWWKKRHKAKK